MIDAAEMEKIQKYEHYRLGVNMAIQYLSYKKRTEKEVSDYLKRMILMKWQYKK